MKKIIVPVDFSDIASDALDFAIDFNKKAKGQLILLHIMEMPSYSFSVIGEVNAHQPEIFLTGKLIEGVKARLEEWSQRVKSANQDVITKMKFGNPYNFISKEISEEEADLVIIGSRGASGLSEIFVGSNTERVIRMAECPVITVKGPSKIEDMKNIVFATDLSEEQDWLAQRAKDVQELLGKKMHIVKVITPRNFLTTKIVRQQLDDFSERNMFENVSLNSIKAEFSEEGILEFAEDVGAGLIILGTHGRTGLGHFIGGSKAEDVANHAHIPIITLKI